MFETGILNWAHCFDTLVLSYGRQNIVRKNPQGFQDECVKALVGTVILTRYNNKTYRIDDIVWDKTPQHGFTTSTGASLTFHEYYK